MVELSTNLQLGSGVLRSDIAFCRRLGLDFEQMFENDSLPVNTDGATPIEFTYRGKRFRIHNVLNRWCEAGGWWNRISDGIYRPDDNARAIWRVEAAPIGSVTTFELERDEATGKWLIRIV
jgi:hypothetical protein